MSSDAPTAARELLRLGRAFRDRGQLEEARALFEAARVTARAIGDGEAEAQAAIDLGRALIVFCEPETAERLFAEAEARYRAIGKTGDASRAQLRTAFAAYDAGDLERASAMLDAVPSEEVGGMLAGYRANLARAFGDYARAEAGYEAAVEQLAAIGDHRYEATFRMDAAILALLDGRAADAIAELGRARDTLSHEGGEPTLLALIDHYALLAAAAIGDDATVKRIGDRFDAPASPSFTFLVRVQDAVRGGGTPSASELPPFEHGRLSMQIAARGTGSDVARRLAVHAGIIELDDVRIDLSARAPLMRLVDALARKKEGATPRELIAAAWPGERMSDKAARNRLHVAIATLRRMGLRDAIVRNGERYAFVPGLFVVRV